MDTNPARTRALSTVALIAATLVVLLVRLETHHATWTDENLHLYVASRVAEGASLYGDIHSARPPLVIWAPALLVKLGLPPLLAGRLAGTLAVLATAGLLLATGAHIRPARAGLWGAVLFLASPAVAARTAYTGMNLVVLGTTACLWAAVAGRGLLAGALGGLALLAGQHAVPIVGLCGLWSLLGGPRRALRFVAGLVGVLALGLVVAWLQGGAHVWEDLVAHHLYHLAGDGSGSPELGWWITTWCLEGFVLLALAGVALLLPGAVGVLETRTQAQFWDPMWLLIAAGVSQLAVVAVMEGGLVLYLHPAVPPVALLAGVGVARLASLESSGPGAGSQRALVWGLLLVLVGGTLAAWSGASERYGARDERSYPLLPQLRFIEMARVAEPRVVEAIVEHIEKVGDSRPVFGYPTITGLVALGSGRKVSADRVDFAPRWFQQGSLDRAELLRQVERDGVGWFVSPNIFFLRDPFFAGWLRACFEQPVVFARLPGSGIPRIFLFERSASSTTCTPLLASHGLKFAEGGGATAPKRDPWSSNKGVFGTSGSDAIDASVGSCDRIYLGAQTCGCEPSCSCSELEACSN